MVYNDTTDEQGIVQEVLALCDTDLDNYSIKSITRRANIALRSLVGKIIEVDGFWQYDDTNHTDTPIGTANLQDDVSSYAFNQEFLAIEQVLVKDSGGSWRTVKPVDPVEYKSIPIEEYYGNSTGFPLVYDKNGNVITFYPSISSDHVTLTGGLQVRFKRQATEFDEDDTTKEPGIPSPFHVLIAWLIALPYLKTYKPDRVPQLERDISTMTADLLAHYGLREKDAPRRMKMRGISFR